ncbi:hypothetical protein HIM_07120 [Hirsutella minnesotensis 3608]|uniref:Uncharacterized protein n=1 Tax=Hirsutella minnesotensis 3608 TaxID=1043627 RepID=A0A0F8A4H0_9HYPO|nr:hypothetical protein HIM_07120 [Hirsutella minnesotensis 3608]
MATSMRDISGSSTAWIPIGLAPTTPPAVSDALSDRFYSSSVDDGSTNSRLWCKRTTYANSMALNEYLRDQEPVTSGPFQYEIRRGRLVPVSTSDDMALESELCDSVTASVRDSVYQWTRQRLQEERQWQQHPSWHQRGSWRPSSSIYDTSNADTTHVTDDSRHRSQFELAPWHMYTQNMSMGVVSPPGSDLGDDQEEVWTPRNASPVNDHSSPAPVLHPSPGRGRPLPAMPEPLASPQAASFIGGASPGRPALVPPPALSQRRRLASLCRPELNQGHPPFQGPSGPSEIPQPIDSRFYIAPLKIRRNGQKGSSRKVLTKAAALTNPPKAETLGPGASTNPLLHPLRPLAIDQQTCGAPAAPLPSRSPPRAHLEPAYTNPPNLLTPGPSPSSVPSQKRSPPNRSAEPTSPSAAKEPHRRRQAIVSLLDSVVNHRHSQSPISPRHKEATTRATANTKKGANRQQTAPGNVVVTPVPHLAFKSDLARQPASGQDPPSLAQLLAAADDRFQTATGGNFTRAAGAYSLAHHDAQPGTQRHQRTPRAFSMMDDASSTSGRSSVMSLTKPLPSSPQGLSAPGDRIAQLNAHIESLVHRRLNISRSIHRMTELMPIDSLFASDEVIRRREAEKLKVQALQDELAEIKREEYDTGLKLFRAYKRADKEAEWEQSHMWIRRATGTA